MRHVYTTIYTCLTAQVYIRTVWMESYFQCIRLLSDKSSISRSPVASKLSQLATTDSVTTPLAATTHGQPATTAAHYRPEIRPTNRTTTVRLHRLHTEPFCRVSWAPLHVPVSQLRIYQRRQQAPAHVYRLRSIMKHTPCRRRRQSVSAPIDACVRAVNDEHLLAGCPLSSVRCLRTGRTCKSFDERTKDRVVSLALPISLSKIAAVVKLRGRKVDEPPPQFLAPPQSLALPHHSHWTVK